MEIQKIRVHHDSLGPFEVCVGGKVSLEGRSFLVVSIRFDSGGWVHQAELLLKGEHTRFVDVCDLSPDSKPAKKKRKTKKKTELPS